MRAGPGALPRHGARPADRAESPERPDGAVARIGPNAVIQLGHAAMEILGADATRRLFSAAGHGALLDTPPEGMIDQRIPMALFAALRALFPEEAARVAARAGSLTAVYILAHRIPRPARLILPYLPRRLALRLLLTAIRKHAWTFAGSGACTVEHGSRPVIAIRVNPMAMPGCAWHAAVFEGLFARLIRGRTVVRHRTCCHDGAPACRFEIGRGR